MGWAEKEGLTSSSYVWIATQSVIGESKEALTNMPAGMLGKQSNLSDQANINSSSRRQFRHFPAGPNQADSRGH